MYMASPWRTQKEPGSNAGLGCAGLMAVGAGVNFAKVRSRLRHIFSYRIRIAQVKGRDKEHSVRNCAECRNTGRKRRT